MKPSRCVLMLLAAGLLAAPTSPLAAQSLMAGPEIQIALAGFFRHDGISPSIAAGPDGGFLASWHEAGINVRGFSPADVPRGNVRKLNRTFGMQIVALGPDRFVGVWADDSDDSSVWGQLVDAAGAPAGAPLELARIARSPVVAATPSGGFLVAWQHNEGPVGSPILHLARRFDGQGQPVGDEIGLGSFDRIGDLTVLPDGGLAVAWPRDLDLGPGNRTTEIHVRAFRADGSPAGPETIVSAGADNPLWKPRVAADSSGRFVVAWTEYPTPQGYQVLAQRFSPTGEPLGPAIQVDEERGWIAYLGDVAVRPNGSFLVSWGRTSAVTGNEPDVSGDVLARVFDAAGAPLGPTFLVHASEEGAQHEGEVAATADGWIVSWKQSFDARAGIYARRFALSCGGSGAALCLNGHRFRATVSWRVPSTGAQGAGVPIPQTSDSGAFWFFAPANYELAVKVLDGRSVNGHFWVFYASLTNVEFDLTVTDTLSGEQRTYHNPAGTMASRADTLAF